MDGDGSLFDLSRRDFIHAGTLSAASLFGVGTANAQEDQTSDTAGFQTIAHLLGPAEARPAPESDFFKRQDFKRTYYGYLYDPTDEYARYYITQDDDRWKTLEMIPTTALDEVATQNATSFFNHTFARPEAPDQKNWLFDSTNVTKYDSEIELASTANLQTTQRGNYPPGNEATPGVAWRVTATPTGGEARAGYYDGSNGCGVGEDSTDSFVFLQKGGSEIKVYRSNWNGHIPDSRVWDDNRPIITRFPHLFYGGGDFKIKALLHGDGESELRELHRFTPDTVNDSFADGPPFDQPNLPIKFESSSLSGGNLRANACHYQFSLEESENRLNGEHFGPVSASSTGWTPLIAWRKRSGWDMVNVKPLKIVAAASTNDARLALQLNPNLSGGTWTLPPNTSSAETAVEVNTGVSLDATGERRWVGFSPAGQGSQSGLVAAEDLSFNLPASQTVVLVAQGVGGTADISGLTEWEEYF